jgi:hypothetical protein
MQTLIHDLCRPRPENDASHGPVPPNQLVNGGRHADIQPKVWRLLNLLWKVGTATLGQVEDEVWGHDACPTDLALNSVVKRANRALETVRKAGHLILEAGK